MGGNLPASALPGTVVSASITVYDGNGAAKSLTFEYRKDPGVDGNNDGDFAVGGDTAPVADLWHVKVKGPQSPAGGAQGYLTTDGTATTLGATPASWDIKFNPATGAIATITPPGGVAGPGTTMTLTQPMLAQIGIFSPDPDLAGPLVADTITVDLDGPEALTQFSGINSLAAQSQDGSAPGALQTFTISQDGTITGVFSNGRTQNIAQIAIANFDNPSGLEKLEGSMYRPTANSGLAGIGLAGIAGRGTLAGGTLEMSNVDLAQEFTNLIVAQRGFQASTRVITASDEVLNDLVNIRR
jgi:flagellar hook protein FlgE